VGFTVSLSHVTLWSTPDARCPIPNARLGIVVEVAPLARDRDPLHQGIGDPAVGCGHLRPGDLGPGITVQSAQRGVTHPRVGIEADRQEGTDVVLKVAHTGDDPVSAADVIDQAQLAEREGVTHGRQYAVVAPIEPGHDTLVRVTPWAVMTVILPNLVLIGFGLMVIAAASVVWGVTRTAPPPPA
jgi:hypothetical protein